MNKITTSAPTTESQTFAERDATVLSPQLRALGNTYGAFEPRVKDMERFPRATITQYWEDGAGLAASALKESELAKEFDGKME